MYYEEANFDRREEAELVFSKAPIPEKLKLDTANIGLQFLNYQMLSVKNDPKFQQFGGDVKLTEESIDMINGYCWHRYVLTLSVTDENKKMEFRMSVFFHYGIDDVHIITLRENMPKIHTVERELPCIMRSIKFKG